MNYDQPLSLGLYQATPNQSDYGIRELLSGNKIDLLVLPEAYISVSQIKIMSQLAKDMQIWIVCGVDEYTDDKRYQSAVMISSSGDLVATHRKTSLTSWEIDEGYESGDEINIIETPFGRIGLSICYEVHFPEVSRIYALQGAELIINPINIGMWNEQQYFAWHSVVSCRASENQVYVAGCSHLSGAIPISFVYDPEGQPLLNLRGAGFISIIELDLNVVIPPEIKFTDRRPDLYKSLA